jgi:hypothetical protein
LEKRGLWGWGRSILEEVNLFKVHYPHVWHITIKAHLPLRYASKNKTKRFALLDAKKLTHYPKIYSRRINKELYHKHSRSKWASRLCVLKGFLRAPLNPGITKKNPKTWPHEIVKLPYKK